MKEKIINTFKEIFSHSGCSGSLYFAPGRVNLIGEHTDYSGGLVLPFGINAGTYIYAVKNNSSKVRIYSKNFNDGIFSIDLNESYKKESHWTDFVKAVILVLKEKYSISAGFDAVIYGDIPDSSGLSSSASFEMALIVSFIDINGYDIPENGSKEMVELALLGQRSENEFIGVNCGIMDQFACANAVENKVIQLNCSDLSFKYADFASSEYEILVINTNKKRKLGESKYNERRKECEDGFAVLKDSGLSYENLGSLPLSEYLDLRYLIKDQTILKRIDHVVNENARVKEALLCLKNNDIFSLAKLLNQSGDSLRELYEVTGYHLDLLVDISRNTAGVIAARMTGAGFGGCTVNIVHSDKLKEACDIIYKKYYEECGIIPDFYSYKPGSGAKKIL